MLIEAHDEWQVSDRRYLSEASMAQLTPATPTALPATPARTSATDHAQEVIPTAVTKTA